MPDSPVVTAPGRSTPRPMREPLRYMAAAVAGYAVLPWLVWLGVRDISLWWFATFWYVAYGMSYVTVRQLTADSDDRAAGRLVMWRDVRAARPALVGLLTVSQLSWLLFAAAVTFADPSVVTVIFESWPLLFGLITVSRIWRRHMTPQASDRPQRSTASTLLMLAVGVAGVALAVLSDAEPAAWSQRASFGLLLACVAAFAAAAGAAAQQAVGKHQQPGRSRDLTAVSASGNAAAQMFAVPFMAATAVTVDGVAQFTLRSVALAVIVGTMQMAANWCLHHANHLARETHGDKAAGINSLYCLAPIAALGLLAVFADTDIARPDLLIVGAAAVVAVNIVMHLDPDGTRQQARSAGTGTATAARRSCRRCGRAGR